MRVGLVGYGKGGRFFHAPLITSVSPIALVGVVIRSPERRAELQQDYPGVPAYDTLAELIDAGVDAVVISTPPEIREGMILEAVSRGVPVVSDKPFALDESRAQLLISAAREAGVPLTVYMNRRWDSDIRTARRMITSGKLGEVLTFESRVETFVSGTRGNASGGGLLRDLGSHLVDQALWLFGSVRSVYAEVRFMDEQQQLDEDFFLSLTHQNGVISRLWGSTIQHNPGPRLKVNGTEGCYRIECLDGQDQALLAGRSPKTERDRWGVEDHLRWGWMQHGEERELVPSERGRWDLFYEHLAAALSGKGELPVSLEDALETTRILDAARRSAQQGQVITLG
ncbi:Gfo/Idh/MocA family oxidoreductase [Pseudomonas luteola]|uniref:Gfo/Idh/MocA family protein n=1 Tax=Pseudomonas luteola TaxID=47886 RepID=UPI003DA1BDC9